MNCPKFTVEGKRCTLPLDHPNFCVHDPASKPVMTKAGLEAQQLVEAAQRGKIIFARNPECKKCHGQAYNELPDSTYDESAQLSVRQKDGEFSKNTEGYIKRNIEYSICSGCGGYLYIIGRKRTSYATKPERPGSLTWAKRAAEIEANKAKEPEKLAPKTISGIARETPDLTAARLAEHERRHPRKRNTNRPTRNYMAEATEQAAKDVDAMMHWNGF